MSARILVPWPMPQAGREVLEKSNAEIIYLHGPGGEIPTYEELIKNMVHANILIPRGTQSIPKEVITANSDLRGIANYGVGYDNIDIAAATRLGIPVTNTPRVLTETTADLAWALLMATARRIPQAHNYTLSGQWKGPGSKVFMGFDVGLGGSNKSKVLGIIGFGRIGRAVMRRSRGFGMKVLAYDPFLREAIEITRGVEYRRLTDLLKESDFVSLHCPLTKETFHLIGEREFDLMKPTSILINTSRGPVVDEKALVLALKKGRIAGAGLDVYENEPAISPGLLELENVVLLPHIGSATKDTREQMAVVAARNALAMLKGVKPPNIVNPQVFKSPKYLGRLKS